MASDLGLHCLPMNHEKDARFIWVKLKQPASSSLAMQGDSPPAGSLCCVLEHDSYPLLSTGSTKETKKTGNRPNMTEKSLTGM